MMTQGAKRTFFWTGARALAVERAPGPVERAPGPYRARAAMAMPGIEDLSKRVLQSYFDAHGMVRHQLESFDHFADVMLEQIVQENSDVVVKTDKTLHTIRFGRVCIPQPTTCESTGFVRTVRGPAEAMARNLSYASAVLVDVTYTVRDAASDTLLRNDVYREVVLCKIPVMVRSRYCYLTSHPGDMSSCMYDPGGYFVINGLEKTLIAQQKLRTNCALVWNGQPPSRASYICEVRSCHERKLRSTSTLCLHLIPGDADRPPHVMVSLPFLETQVTLTGLFKLLGCEDIDEMVSMCATGGSKFGPQVAGLARDILIEGMERRTAEELRVHIGDVGTTERTRERKDRYIEHILGSEVLPHMGLGTSPQARAAKVMYLGHMMHRLLLVHLGLRPVDDRDHFKNKRVDAPGHSMSLLFRQLFRQYLKGLHVQLNRTVSNPQRQLNIPRLVNARKITSGFKYAMATGNWGICARNNTAQCGVAQVLNRNSLVASLADKRRLSCPANRDSKNAAIRQLHPSSFGIVCPCETPEGASCGLILNLTVMAHVRINTCPQATMKGILDELPPSVQFVPLEASDAAAWEARVFHDGVLRGFVPLHKMEAMCEELRKLRSSNALPSDCSIALVETAGEIHIGTDAGCLCRPVFVLRELPRLAAKVEECRVARAPLWPALVATGIVVYIDKEEEQALRVASTFAEVDAADAPEHRYTHVEIHPSVMLGISASMIPFPDHNQAPRNTYQCAMGKQAIGVYASDSLQRFDTVGFGLWYPQRPLVGTWAEDVIGSKFIPTGTNAIVAVMTYGGFNQEDSLIFNAASLERGMMRCSVSRTVRDEVGGEGYEFCRPPTDSSLRKTGCYSKLRECGTVPVGTLVHQGDVVIGKVRVASARADEATPQDFSTSAKCAGQGVVDRVLSSTNRDGMALKKVRILEERQPFTGDKFTSRHGQKGVIGAVYRAEDMPFTSDGRQPDIIMNPHALPSRMTIGQLVESILSVLCCHEGRIGDGTAFGEHGVEAIGDRLEQHGLSRYSTDTMYNGTVGTAMEAEIFMAPVYMQSLKHQVIDKCHARARGPVDAKTRQPTEGRRQDGGLRFGEMERDCLVGHGAASTLQERLFTQSDPYECHVCTACGLLADPGCDNHEIATRKPFCRTCCREDTVRLLPMPYATKLFLQEVMGTNIAPLIRVETKASGEGAAIADAE